MPLFFGGRLSEAGEEFLVIVRFVWVCSAFYTVLSLGETHATAVRHCQTCHVLPNLSESVKPVEPCQE